MSLTFSPRHGRVAGANTMTCSFPVVLLGVAVLTMPLCLSHPAAAQDSPSIEEQLFGDLNKPLDELDREKSRPPQNISPEVFDEQIRNWLRQEPGDAATSQRDESPQGRRLMDVARQMRQVESRIGQNDAGIATQQVQVRIISDLDELIEQAKKKCNSSACAPKPGGKPKPGSGKPSSKPVSRSNAKPGRGDASPVNMGEVHDAMKELWGELPQRERNHMLQLPIGEFLPKYELLIEAYFRSLTEGEKPWQP